MEAARLPAPPRKRTDRREQGQTLRGATVTRRYAEIFLQAVPATSYATDSDSSLRQEEKT